MQKNNSPASSYTHPLITVVVALAIWWASSAAGWINPLFLPTLGSFGKAFINLLSGPDIYLDSVATSYRALLGLLLSSVVAIPLGLFFGRFPKFYQFVELPTDFFRSIPSSALFFLLVLFFGIGDLSKIAVVFYGCSLILLINTVYGARPTREKRDRIKMLQSFGATPRQIFHLAVFRDALPHIAAGMRVCISLSLVLVIVTEMFLSATRGLGRQIYDFYLAYRIPEMYAAIAFLGLIGFGANKLFVLFERKAIFWLPTQT